MANHQDLSSKVCLKIQNACVRRKLFGNASCWKVEHVQRSFGLIHFFLRLSLSKMHGRLQGLKTLLWANVHQSSPSGMRKPFHTNAGRRSSLSWPLMVSTSKFFLHPPNRIGAARSIAKNWASPRSHQSNHNHNSLHAFQRHPVVKKIVSKGTMFELLEMSCNMCETVLAKKRHSIK